MNPILWNHLLRILPLLVKWLKSRKGISERDRERVGRALKHLNEIRDFAATWNINEGSDE